MIFTAEFSLYQRPESRECQLTLSKVLALISFMNHRCDFGQHGKREIRRFDHG